MHKIFQGSSDGKIKYIYKVPSSFVNLNSKNVEVRIDEKGKKNEEFLVINSKYFKPVEFIDLYTSFENKPYASKRIEYKEEFLLEKEPEDFFKYLRKSTSLNELSSNQDLQILYEIPAKTKEILPPDYKALSILKQVEPLKVISIDSERFEIIPMEMTNDLQDYRKNELSEKFNRNKKLKSYKYPAVFKSVQPVQNDNLLINDNTPIDSNFDIYKNNLIKGK